MYAEFEKTIHELVENNKSINALVLDDIWGQLLTKYYGKDYELDQLAKVGWSRIPHFYNSFYVYKYATGCSAGVSFAQDILKNEDYLKHILGYLPQNFGIYPNLSAREFLEYEYVRDREGNVITGYPDKNNHSIDSVRYATT